MHYASRRGRPSRNTKRSHDDDAIEQQRLEQQAREARADFCALPPKAQEELRAHVQRILDEPDQRRLRPSPLARCARYVYDIEVPWISPEFEVRPKE
jgi:hypothetical protein